MKRRESETERGCKEHSNPEVGGVCSSCLRDKLSKLYDDSSNKKASSQFYSPQAWSSQSSSHCVSPEYHQNLKDSGSSMLGLKKSRSSGFVTTSRGVRDGNLGSGRWGSKKQGFWSKLFHKRGHQ